MNAAVIAHIVNIGLGVGAVVFVALLAGAGSGALTNEPTADEVDAYASTRTTTTASATGATTAAPGGGGEARFVVTAIDFEADTVAITNVGDSAGTLDGLWLCNFPRYVPIDGEIAAGETLDVGFGVTAADGEVGLYTSNSFGDSSSIISYVEWGTSGHARSGVAVEAGVWDGESVSGDASRLVALVTEPAAAVDWSGE